MPSTKTRTRNPIPKGLKRPLEGWNKGPVEIELERDLDHQDSVSVALAAFKRQGL